MLRQASLLIQQQALPPAVAAAVAAAAATPGSPAQQEQLREQAQRLEWLASCGVGQLQEVLDSARSAGSAVLSLQGGLFSSPGSSMGAARGPGGASAGAATAEQLAAAARDPVTSEVAQWLQTVSASELQRTLRPLLQASADELSTLLAAADAHSSIRASSLALRLRAGATPRGGGAGHHRRMRTLSALPAVIEQDPSFVSSAGGASPSARRLQSDMPSRNGNGGREGSLGSLPEPHAAGVTWGERQPGAHANGVAHTATVTSPFQGAAAGGGKGGAPASSSTAAGVGERPSHTVSWLRGAPSDQALQAWLEDGRRKPRRGGSRQKSMGATLSFGRQLSLPESSCEGSAHGSDGDGERGSGASGSGSDESSSSSREGEVLAEVTEFMADAGEVLELVHAVHQQRQEERQQRRQLSQGRRSRRSSRNSDGFSGGGGADAQLLPVVSPPDFPHPPQPLQPLANGGSGSGDTRHAITSLLDAQWWDDGTPGGGAAHSGSARGSGAGSEAAALEWVRQASRAGLAEMMARHEQQLDHERMIRQAASAATAAPSLAPSRPGSGSVGKPPLPRAHSAQRLRQPSGSAATGVAGNVPAGASANSVAGSSAAGASASGVPGSDAAGAAAGCVDAAWAAQAASWRQASQIALQHALGRAG